MPRHADPPPAGPGPGPAGVRIVRKPGRRVHAVGLAAVALALLAAALAVLAWWPRGDALQRPSSSEPATADERARQAIAVAGGVMVGAGSSPDATPGSGARATGERLPATDANDLASYFKPGDPEPSGREVIEALHDAGVHTGIGAFNPPGTSPPLAGLAVPPTFVLPPGYVRHHQVTDEGVPLEPILMFAPDFVLRDAQGRPRPMPADRVVPPSMAPPGLPLRRIRVPPTP